MIKGIIQSGSITLKNMAQYVSSKGLLKSKIAKVERLIHEQLFDYTQIAKLILQILTPLLPDKLLIAIDRTNWQFGQKDINYLVASIVVGKISVPIVWMLLDKKGNSNTSERQELMDQLLQIIPVKKIANILADREFVGKDWLTYLFHTNIPFVIRVKENEQIQHPNGGKMRLKRYFGDLKFGEYSAISTQFAKLNLHVTCLKLKTEKLIVVSPNAIGLEALETYAQRWSIERCFKSLKGSGFNLEETHITSQERLRKLFTVASLALAFCVAAGHVKAQVKSIYTKKHGRSLFSLFTYGFDWLKEYFIEPQKEALKNLYDTLMCSIFSLKNQCVV
jgi:hypothetical protein